MSSNYRLPSSFPIADPKSEVARIARDLHAKAVTQRASANATTRDVEGIQRAPREIEAQLEAELRNAATAGKASTPKADRLAKALAEARAAAAEPHDVRARAARRAAEDASNAYRLHVAAHAPAIVEELRPVAEDARRRVLAAVAEVEAAAAAWHAVSADVVGLIALVQGLDGRDVPALPRLLADGIEVPVPMPKPEAVAYVFQTAGAEGDGEGDDEEVSA